MEEGSSKWLGFHGRMEDAIALMDGERRSLVPDAVQRPKHVHARLRRAMALLRRAGTATNFALATVPVQQRTTRVLRCARDTGCAMTMAVYATSSRPASCAGASVAAASSGASGASSVSKIPAGKGSASSATSADGFVVSAQCSAV